MKNTAILLSICLLAFLGISACKKSGNDAYEADTKDAAKGVEVLNDIRRNPANYGATIGIDLSYINAKPLLVWNDTLAKAAQDKAMDMATRKYFGHTDPDGNGMNIKISEAGYYLVPEFLTSKGANNFESLGAGYADIEDAVRNLVIDKDVPDFGHRHHLLGHTSFWNNCYDIGIGVVRAKNPSSVGQDQFVSYYCFLVAKHNF